MTKNRDYVRFRLVKRHYRQNVKVELLQPKCILIVSKDLSCISLYLL